MLTKNFLKSSDPYPRLRENSRILILGPIVFLLMLACIDDNTEESQESADSLLARSSTKEPISETAAEAVEMPATEPESGKESALDKRETLSPGYSLGSPDGGEIQVRCLPGLSIYIDGEFAGLSVPEEDGRYIRGVPQGEHFLTIEKEGFLPYTQSVQVVAWKTTEISVQELSREIVARAGGQVHSGALEPEVGSLIVSCAPVRCSFAFLGHTYTVSESSTYQVLMNVPAGVHEIVFRRGNQTLAGDFRIKNKELQEVQGDFLNREVIDITARRTAIEAERHAAAIAESEREVALRRKREQIEKARRKALVEKQREEALARAREKRAQDHARALKNWEEEFRSRPMTFALSLGGNLFYEKKFRYWHRADVRLLVKDARTGETLKGEGRTVALRSYGSHRSYSWEFTELEPSDFYVEISCQDIEERTRGTGFRGKRKKTILASEEKRSKVIQGEPGAKYIIAGYYYGNSPHQCYYTFDKILDHIPPPDRPD